MELWIRSQDKEILIKCEKIMIQKSGGVFGILNYIDIENWFRLGIYKTEKRALEVLDEIQKLLMPQVIIKNIDTSVKIDNLVHIVNPTYETIQQVSTYVYEMPKE